MQIPHVLIVEDNANTAFGHEMNLAAEGFSTVIAESAEVALELIAARRPDLVSAAGRTTTSENGLSAASFESAAATAYRVSPHSPRMFPRVL